MPRPSGATTQKEVVAEDPQLESHPKLAEEVLLLLSEDQGEYRLKS